MTHLDISLDPSFRSRKAEPFTLHNDPSCDDHAPRYSVKRPFPLHSISAGRTSNINVLWKKLAPTDGLGYAFYRCSGKSKIDQEESTTRRSQALGLFEEFERMAINE